MHDGFAFSPQNLPRSAKQKTRRRTDDDNICSEAPPKKTKLFSKRAKVGKHKPVHFKFLRLPGEIRNIIYHFALTRLDKIVVKDRKRCTKNCRPISVAILRTCKIIHAEARGILYSQPILIGERGDPILWLRDIGPENRFYLRDVHLASTRGFEKSQGECQLMSKKVAMLLADAPRLESLTIQAMRIPDIDVNWAVHHIQNGQMKEKRGIIAARHIAKQIYDGFRPVFSHALSRGTTPQQLCKLVKFHWKIFSGRSHPGETPKYNALRLGFRPPDFAEAEAELTRHMEFLLERNLQYRRHPRFKQLSGVV